MWLPPRRRSARNNRKLRPLTAAGLEEPLALEPRLLLNASAEQGAASAIKHAARHAPHHAKAAHPSRRLTPAQEINVQYALFTAGFANTLSQYVDSINDQATNDVSVQATVTATYTPPSAVVQVNNASVFGPQGSFSQEVAADALIGTVSLGTFYFSGSSGNLLIVDTSKSPSVELPVGTVLSASVPTSAQSSASAIFPSYITDSTIQMAITLVKYFNGLPVKLPAENAPPHTPVQRGAIQTFVYDSIAGIKGTSLYQYTNGNSPPSLQQLLLAIPLPTTAGPDLEIYESSVVSAIAESHQQLNDAISGIYKRSILVSAQPPANRLGENFNSSSGSGSSSSGSSSSSTGSTSSSSTT